MAVSLKHALLASTLLLRLTPAFAADTGGTPAPMIGVLLVGPGQGMVAPGNDARFAPGPAGQTGGSLIQGGNAAVDTNSVAGRTLALHETDLVNVKNAPYNALGDGVADDTAAINAAAAAVPAVGGVLEIPAGNYLVYGTSTYNALLVHSNTTVRCEGATITAGGPNANNLALIQNVDYSARVLTDHDIRVTGCNFVFPAWVAGQAGKAMNFWFTAHVEVDANTLHGGANMTAMIGSYDTLTTGNRAYGVTNAAFDHFWGGGRHRVLGNYAEVAPNPGGNAWGTQFTGGDIANNPVSMTDIQATDNTILFNGGSSTVGAPIGVNSYGSTGLVSQVSIRGNHLTNTVAGNTSPGIYLASVAQKVISENVITGAGAPSILEDPAQSNATTKDTVVEGNMLIGCGYTGNWVGEPSLPYTANIMLTGFNNTVRGNRSSGCTGQLISHTQPSSTIERDNDDGTGTVHDFLPGLTGMSNNRQSDLTLAGTSAALATQILTPTSTVLGGSGGLKLPQVMVNGVEVVQPGDTFEIDSAVSAAWSLYPYPNDVPILGGASSWSVAAGSGTAPTVVLVKLINTNSYGLQWLRTR